MTAKIIDGKEHANHVVRKVKARIASLAGDGAAPPCLAVVLAGDDSASQVYVANKIRWAREIGIRSIERRLLASISETDLLREVCNLAQDRAVHGILVQLPLPDQVRESVVLDAVPPDKDVDGFHVENAGRLASGRSTLVPCTPKGCMMLIKDRLGDIAGARAVVLGRSNIVGKPMAQLLLAANATVTVAHSRTRDLPDLCREADILVAAVGRPEMVRGSWIKPGALVVDVGINRIPAPERGAGRTRLVGDVAFEEARKVAGAITPVPGGVGPMTIACLLANTLEARNRIMETKAAVEVD